MKNKIVYIVGAVIIVLGLVVFIKTKSPSLAPENNTDTKTENKTSGTGATKGSTVPKSGQTTSSGAVKTSTFPEIDFINKRFAFELKDFPGVKFTLEQIAFGRGDAVTSTGCSGIPNANFSTYLYPGSGICIGESGVDGSPRGIVAFHILVENNSNVGFGGNSNALRLHYLRSDSSGKPVDRFAHPLNGLDKYYINGYSSKKVVLSYLVPEDQLIYELVSGYKEPLSENKTLNVFDFSTNGFLIDWITKNIKLVK